MRNRRKNGGEKGHSLVEAGFIILPLVFFFGTIVDVGMALMVQACFQHAAREGARYAITYQTAQGLGHDASIKAKVKDEAFGFIRRDDQIEIKYYDKDNPNLFIAPPAGNSPDNIVVVEVKGFSWAWMFPGMMGSNRLAIAARSSDRMESLGAAQARPTR